MVNADKPGRWKDDIRSSVAFYNGWFLRFALVAFQSERSAATAGVLDAFARTADLANLSDEAVRADPRVFAALRMCCAPPLARDRLAGLAGVGNGTVKSLEGGRLPRNGEATGKLIAVVRPLLDTWLFPWLAAGTPAAAADRALAASVVADRLCGARSDPIIRNAQEARQRELLGAWLRSRGYRLHQPAAGPPLTDLPAGTYTAGLAIRTGPGRGVSVPVDAAVQPHTLRPSGLPVLFELKSAGDYANVNKRRKEEAKKAAQLKAHLGRSVEYVLLLCGYFNAGYLGYEAAEGIDWVWEHRLDDLADLGL
jgi:hypothetical protein